MDYDLTVNPKTEEVYVRASGIPKMENLHELSGITIQKVKDERLSRILVDLRELEPDFSLISSSKLLAHSKEFVQLLTGEQVLHMAFVSSSDLTYGLSRQWGINAELYSQNLKHRTFTNLEKAMTWLRGYRLDFALL